MTWQAKALLGLLAIGLILLGGKCYGDARAKQAVAVRQAMLEDSTADVYALRYKILEDSARNAAKGADHVRDSMVTASAHATAIATQARHDADLARKQYAALTAADTASATPAVKATLAALSASNDSLQMANDSLVKANKGLLFALDTMATATRRLYAGLDQADSTIKQYRVTVAAFQAVKTPSSHPVIRVLEFVGVGIAAALGGRATR